MNNFMSELMAEMVSYGGMAATRTEVYADALDTCTHNARTKFGMAPTAAAKAGVKAAEMFAFGPRAIELTPEEVAQRPRFTG